MKSKTVLIGARTSLLTPPPGGGITQVLCFLSNKDFFCTWYTRPQKGFKKCRLLSPRNDRAMRTTSTGGMTVAARSTSSGARKTRPFTEFPRAFLMRGYTGTCRLCAWRAWSRRVKKRWSCVYHSSCCHFFLQANYFYELCIDVALMCVSPIFPQYIPETRSIRWRTNGGRSWA